MAYKYVAYTNDRNVVTGTIGVTDEGLAEQALGNAGYSILSLKEIKLKSGIGGLFPSFFGVKHQDVVHFSNQLATLIGSGISLSSALHTLAEQASKPSVKKVITELYEELQGGSSLSNALAKYPTVFPDIYRQIVGSGEKSGNLDAALRQAVKYMERGTTAIKKARNAMIYPAILVIVAICVVTLLLTVALPPLLSMFDELDVKVPWTTRLLISTTDFLSAYKFHIIGVVLILAISIFWYLRRPEGRLMLDRLLVKLPLIGPITVRSNMALFSRTSSVLLGAGIPLPQILDVAHQITGNRVIKKAMSDVKEGLIQGQGLSKPMAANKVFPSLLVQVVTVGEQTGTLDSNLDAIADFYEEDVNQKISILISLIQPIMTVAMGLMVGFIALSVIMPMYQIMGHLE